MSTDDAGTPKDAENIEATDDAATEGESVAATTETPATTDLGKKSATPDEPKAAAPAPQETKAPEGRSGLLPIVAAFVAGILLVAAVTAVVVFSMQADKRGDELAAVDDATHAACVFGRNVSTYDYSKDLDGYFTTVKGGATGDFLKEFSDASGALKDAMVKAQVKSWVDDVQCGFQSGDTESAKVLVTLTQFRSNFTEANPDRQYVVVIADMQNEGGAWKVSKLDSPMLKGTGTGLPGGGAAGNGAGGNGAAGGGGAAPNGQAPAPSGQAPAPGN